MIADVPKPDPFRDVEALVRRFQSPGRAFVARILGATGVEVQGAGAWITDHAGRRYFDAGSFSVFLFGHSPPAIVSAVKNQLNALSGSTRVLLNAENAKAAAKLVEFAGAPFARCMILNSGAEAVEAALKLARTCTGRSDIVHFEKSFHGKTLGALSVTDIDAIRERVGPLLPGVSRVSRTDVQETCRRISSIRPAAVILEAVQGEGGAFAISAEMLRGVRDATREAGTLLICDEIQCGLGRTGDRFAFEASNASPDIVLMGKALGGGLIPASALIATEEAFAPFARDPFLHTSTFGGNPLASAAILAVLQIYEDDAVPAQARKLGQALANILHGLVAAFPRIIASIRGRGLLHGIEFSRADLAAEFMQACLRRNVLVTPCMSSPEVVRITPPVIASPEDIVMLGEVFERSLTDCAMI